MSNIPIKFTADTPRVKSLSFHPHRPWLLVGLVNGVIQIWDYRLEALVQAFSDGGNNSPIRCVQWHPTQPIFAAAGDDQAIRVFNYQSNSCLFVLTGHSDYIRSLQFHHEQPWLITASDDQTAKIWNWQSRQCICTLLGHHYYVMDAKFHPFLPLIATASLDNTVRIWNYSQMLLKQNGGGLVPPPMGMKSPNNGALDGVLPDIEIVGVLDQASYISLVTWYYHQPTATSYLFFAGKENDIKVFTLNEINFSTFHHETLRINGHTNSITSISISQQSDTAELLTTSEDGTAKIWAPVLSNGHLSWNSNNTTPVSRPNGETAWAGAIDNKSGRLYAVGYETGFCLFKVSRERYGYGVVLDNNNNVNNENGKVFWMSSKGLYQTELYTATKAQLDAKASGILDSPMSSRSKANPLIDLTTGPKDHSVLYSIKTGTKLSNAPQYVRSFYINAHNKTPTQTQIIFTKGGNYTLLNVNHPTQGNNTGGNVAIQIDSVKEMFSGTAKNAVFISNTRVGLLTKESEFMLLSLQNEVKRKIGSLQLANVVKQYTDTSSSAAAVAAAASLGSDSQPTPQSNVPLDSHSPPELLKQFSPTGLFPGPNGYVLLRVPDYLLLLDTNAMKIVADFILPSRLTVKRVSWSADFSSLVICTKTLLYYTSCDINSPNKTLSLLTTHVDNSRIKSLCFDNTILGDVILFNTATHLKFLMKNGHVGILKTLNDICYLSTLTLVPSHVLKQQQLEQQEREAELQGKKVTQTGNTRAKKAPQQDAVVLPTPYDRNIHFFTRQGKYCTMRVNCIEYIFKRALHQRVTQTVAEIMFSGLLNGNNVINYVCDMGYYDLALHLSTDIKEKFSLSLQCGNLKDAIDCAIQINQPKVWEELSFFALQCGNVLACEQAYINTQNLYLLSFLYILTGQTEKLQRIINMCLANPPASNANSNGQEQHNTYELGIWLSFFLGQRNDVLGKLFTHLTQGGTTPQTNGKKVITVEETLLSQNNLFNKPTVLMLLKFTSQASLLVNNNPNSDTSRESELIQSITNELDEMNEIYKTTNEFQTTTILHEANPHNINKPLPPTFYEQVIQRPIDSVGSYPISAQYLKNVLDNTEINNDDELEDELVELLVNAPNLAYSTLNSTYPTQHIKLPPPIHFDLAVDGDRDNNNNTGLITAWNYLSQQDDFQPHASQITSLPSSPWPLISLQQLQQQQQHSQQINNPTGTKKTVGNNNAMSSNSGGGDDDWFADILSHAEGLANGGDSMSSSSSQGTNQQQQAQASSPSNQETWDLDDLDLGDDNDNNNGYSNNNDDFMDFDNNNNQQQQQGGDAVGSKINPILAKFGQFLSLSDGPSLQHNWLADVNAPLSQQTLSTSRQFLAGDFNTAFNTLQSQVAPVLQNDHHQQFFLSTLIKNNQTTSFPSPAIFPSLTHLDTTSHIPVSIPDQADLTIIPQTTIPLQCTLQIQPTPQQLQQGQQSVVIPLPFNPVTVTTIKDRYQLALHYANNSQFDQAIMVSRHLLQLLPLTTALPTSYQNNTDLKFIYHVPYYARELILLMMCEEGKAKSQDNQRKAMYGILATFAQFPSFPSASQQQQQQQQQQSSQDQDTATNVMMNYQVIYDLTLNALWLGCKYAFQLNNFNTVSLLCRKILALGQQYHSTYQANKVQFDAVKKLLKKCEVEGYKEVAPITFNSPMTKQQEKFEFNALSQIQQQTQQIGNTSFVSQYQYQNQSNGITEQLPKGLNILVCSRSLAPITTTQILQTSVVLCSYCQAAAYTPFNNQQCRVCQIGTYGGVTATTQNGLQYQ